MYYGAILTQWVHAAVGTMGIRKANLTSFCTAPNFQGAQALQSSTFGFQLQKLSTFSFFFHVTPATVQSDVSINCFYKMFLLSDPQKIVP